MATRTPKDPHVTLAPKGDRKRAVADRARAESERESLLHDIVDYMERERSLMDQLVEQSALLELAPDAIFARDAERRITFWNRAAESAYGFTREEALGRRPRDLLQTRYPIALEEIERQVTETGLWEGDLVQTTKDGRQVTVTSRWGALYDGAGNLEGLLEINRDITDRLEAQARQELGRVRLERERLSARLVRAQRLEGLGHLAGGIAHDFNNLLAVITGYSDVVLEHLAELDGELDAERRRTLSDDVAQIAQAARRAAGLTAQLLAFARQETVTAEVIDVNATIAETLELLRRTLGAHIELSTALDPELDRVRIDPGQLSQVLVNLAVNSRDAMPQGGRLAIETSGVTFERDRDLSHGILPPGRYIRIRVNDTGVGMSADVVERAFDPFFTTRPVGEGTGLGLATVYGIATQAGGHVQLYSEPGLGTTVSVLLPATADGVPATADGLPEPQEADRAAAEPPGERRRILIVEDEPALRRLIARGLTDAGYEVVTASGSNEALATALESDEPIDLLLTDVVMPEIMGPALAERIHAARPEVRVLFMSGFARPALDDPDVPLNGPLLQKPFTAQELLAGVAAALGDRGDDAPSTGG